MPFWKLGKKRIYADAAASVPLSSAARAELERALKFYGNPGGVHKEAVEAKKELERARASVALSIGAHPDEIIFTSGGTEANNLSLHMARRHAVASAIEHLSVLEPLRHSGARLTILPVSREGLVDSKEVAQVLEDDTDIVSVGLVNSEVGTIEPVREIARTLRHTQGDSHPLFHTDASQAPLWLPLKVERLHADLMALDSQKVGGPRGVGALYIKRGIEVPPLILGGGQERGLRAGTENVALACAFAAALEEAQEGVEERAARVGQVRDYLWSEIRRRIKGAILNGPALGANRVANNLNVSVPGLEAQMAVVALDAMGIAASTRSACSAGEEEPSHVIKALGVPQELVGSAVRFTLLPDATKAQAGRIAEALEEVSTLYKR